MRPANFSKGKYMTSTCKSLPCPTLVYSGQPFLLGFPSCTFSLLQHLDTSFVKQGVASLHSPAPDSPHGKCNLANQDHKQGECHCCCVRVREVKGVWPQEEMYQEYMRLHTEFQNMSQPRIKEGGLRLPQKLLWGLGPLNFRRDKPC